MEKAFLNKEDKSLFYSETYFINNHSPQHSTYIELEKLNLLFEDYKIFTIIRHPYERFISEYNYLYTKNNLEDINNFAKKFLGSSKNKYNWDNHHLSCSEFIKECKNINILRYENLQEDFKNFIGFNLLEHENKGNKIITLVNLTKKN
ncbi:MAG TPA: sulfotransferase family 2 domain-containing protein [Burkholderiales bacterium]|nr:sulfotransferase family 2 domain-containing protein [Burkholderiales bacterium]